MKIAIYIINIGIIDNRYRIILSFVHATYIIDMYINLFPTCIVK